MQTLTKEEVSRLTPKEKTATNNLIEAVLNIKSGEGVLIKRSEWDRSTHPMNVVRHMALYRKKSPLYKMRFCGRKVEGKGKDWIAYAIIRK